MFYTSFSKRCRSDSVRFRQFLGHEWQGHPASFLVWWCTGAQLQQDRRLYLLGLTSSRGVREGSSDDAPVSQANPSYSIKDGQNFFLNSMVSKRTNMTSAQRMAALNSLDASLPVSKAQCRFGACHHLSPPTKALLSIHGKFCSAACILHTLKWRHLLVWNSFRAGMVIKNK